MMRKRKKFRITGRTRLATLAPVAHNETALISGLPISLEASKTL